MTRELDTPLIDTPLIDAVALEALVTADDVVVLDVSVHFPPARFDGDYRPESGYAGWVEGHIPGSRHVDLMTTFSDRAASLHFTRPCADQLSDDLAALGVEPGASIVIYDQGSMTWASRFWWVLRNAGIYARVLDGGLAEWTRIGLPVGTGPEAASGFAESRWAASDLGLWVDQNLVAAVSTGSRPGTLVCALSPEQYAGTEKTRYSRRGHIPASLNLSAKSLLDDEGLMLPITEVSTRAGSVLRGHPKPVVIYCGGGVSACLTALGLVMSGYGDVKIYDGSLEEWTADPALPMVTGNAPGEGDRCHGS
ncbi:rhodanese-like domain-containing protein [Rhodococcus sp. IEGM 1379]|uniref:sulfurtransferase n=1 Tax=Rhodococcus sp. IEGM 1379 TaxID=3047086 RepID=UPI0024B75C41|nr:rhodanese-like domain-containing protein [Rhodococcus sp. IEGM 1379]MDI9916738.1 rhodanese-like domain-containing protein [Rhodococcus sp. IEGM 1379]